MALTPFQRDICRLLAGNRIRSGESYVVLSVIRERPTFVEADVRRGEESVVIQWAQDSAYRFFPLVQHEGRIRGAFPRIVR